MTFSCVAALYIPWEWVPGGTLTPARAEDLFTRAELERADAYSNARAALGWAWYGASVSVILLLGITPLGARFFRKTTGRLPWIVSVPIAAFVIQVLSQVASLVFSVEIHRVDVTYGMSTWGWEAWAKNYALSALVNAVVVGVLALAIAIHVRLWQRFWFLPGAGIGALLVVLGAFLQPVLLEALSNDNEAMAPGALRSSLLELAHEQGLEIEEIWIAHAPHDTRREAYVSGLGSTRRVVLFDTLLEQPAERVEIVVAHEMAHVKYGDVATGVALGVVAIVFCMSLLAALLASERLRRFLSLQDERDPAAVVFVLAFFECVSFVGFPIRNTMSRAVEVRADRASLLVTQAASETFIDMHRRLALRGLEDPTPPLFNYTWFSTHPTVLDRAGLPSSLEMARAGVSDD